MITGIAAGIFWALDTVILGIASGDDAFCLHGAGDFSVALCQYVSA